MLTTVQHRTADGIPVTERRCVFIDFDGTLADHGIVPAAHVEAVRAAQLAQIPAVLCLSFPDNVCRRVRALGPITPGRTLLPVVVLLKSMLSKPR